MDKLRKRRTYQPWEMPPFAYRDWVRGVWLERAKRMERPGVRSKKADVSNAGGHEVHVTDPFENAVLPEKALTEWRVDPRLRTPSEMWVEILSEDHLKAGKLFAGTWDQKGIESKMPPFAYRDWVRGVWLERAKRMERPGVRSKKADVSNAGGHEVHVTDPFENAVLPEKALTEWRVDPRLRTPSEMWVEILSEDHLKAGKLFAGTWDQKGIESKMQEAGISWRWFEREMVENRDFYRYILRMRAQKMGSLLLNLDAEVIRRMNDVGLENMEGKDLDRVYGVIEKATNMAERMVRRDEKEYEKLQQLNERKTGVEDAKFVEIPEDDAKRLDEARKELKGEDG